MKVKKFLALAMSATMAMGIAMPVMAADPTVTAPIYSFEVLDVIVPTTYQVAFNPEGLTVKTGDSTNSTDQILSRNYGMINKGNKDQVMTVALKVEDQNTGDNKVTFVDSADEVTNAKAGEYKVHLMAVPADTTEVQVGTTPASASKTTTSADLDSVTMTKAAATTAVTLKGGDNKIAFKLDKAVYSPKGGSELELGASGSTSNNVASNFEITNLAANGKGITAFTFSGTMNNTDTNWSKLTSGIKITATYSHEIAPSGATPLTGTGAMIKVGPQVTLSTTGEINITGLEGTYTSFVLNDGTDDWELGGADGTWTAWDDAADAAKTFQLGDNWMSGYLAGKTVKIKVGISDDVTIESSSVVFPGA